jgi:5-methylcytosine-specific restriction enzyme subunit McrC
MNKSPTITHFTVFQNQILKINQTIGDQKFLWNHLQELQEWYGEKGVPYFSLIHEGIQFQGYVGLLQIKSTLYEILPFIEGGEVSESYWRDILSYMLRVVGDFEFLMQFGATPKKNRSILEPYFSIFLDEIEILLHRGLIKNYIQKEANKNNLKGKLIFSKQIQKNLIHKERMFVKHTSYSQDNSLNSILYATLKWIEKESLSPEMKSRTRNLMNSFPKMPSISISEKLFSKIRYDRNTLSYKRAISIARFLLLKYAPGFLPGADGTIALLVDINLLWKRFIYKVLKKDETLSSFLHVSRLQLWESPNKKKIMFNSVLHFNKSHPTEHLILETKWEKAGVLPNESIVKDLFIQAKLLEAPQTILVLPGLSEQEITSYYKETSPVSKILLTCIYDRKADIQIFKKNFSISNPKSALCLQDN